MDLHLAYFTASFATWYKILTSQSNGDPCAGVLCPQPRRDASIKMMGNDGGNNGRYGLLLGHLDLLLRAARTGQTVLGLALCAPLAPALNVRKR